MEQQAILVSHGAPSDPQTQERAIQALAVRVRFWAPDWQVSGTTLAAKGELEATLTSLPDAVIYPFFMAEGYFTRIALPKRLKALGRNHAFQHKAFGHAPELPSLMVKTALRAAETAGYAPKDTQLLLAAHGSQVTRASYEQLPSCGLSRHLNPWSRDILKKNQNFLKVPKIWDKRFACHSLRCARAMCSRTYRKRCARPVLRVLFCPPSEKLQT
jgi:sirohydrochlorin ferrochelatase